MGFLVSEPTSAAAEARTERKVVTCKPERFMVPLDVGHTVENQGATSARGVKEYVFNLRLAKVMEKALWVGGFSQAHLFVTAAAACRFWEPIQARRTAPGARISAVFGRSDVVRLRICWWANLPVEYLLVAPLAQW